MSTRTLILILTIHLIPLHFQENGIQEIRTLYRQTEENRPKYSLVSLDDLENSSEGGKLNIYRDSTEIKLIEAIYYGSISKVLRHFYYESEDIYFVFIEEFLYNAPISSSEYDPNKTFKKESRYYFWNNQMIRWIQPNGELEPNHTLIYMNESDRVKSLSKQTLKISKK